MDGGGGGTDSFEFGYRFGKNSPPPHRFGAMDSPLVLPSPNVQPLLFTKAKDSHFKSSLINEFIYLLDSIVLKIFVLRDFLNNLEGIHLHL